MDKFILKLKEQSESKASLIKETLCDYNQFERNCYNNEYVNLLSFIINNLEKHYSYISSNVVKYLKSFNYINEQEYLENDKIDKLFNPIDRTPILFTEELYEEFKKKYITFLIKKLSEEVLNSYSGSISTSYLSNAVDRVRNQAKIKVIDVLTEYIEFN